MGRGGGEVTGEVKGSEREGGGTAVLIKIVERPVFGSRLSSCN